MMNYFVEIQASRIVLWNYLFWYVSMLIQYFDASPRIWLTSAGISLIVGIALVLNTTSSWAGVLKTDRWQIVRLFLMPFFVSSFSALVKDQGFILIVSTRWNENIPGLALCGAFTGGVLGLKFMFKASPDFSPQRR